MAKDIETEHAVRQSFIKQAEGCERLGSPFTGRLLRGLAPALNSDTKTGSRILGWQGIPDATGDAVPLRLAAALHNLVRCGRSADLKKFYLPDFEFEDSELTDAALATIERMDDEVLAWLDFAPQTNEVRRASIIYAGLLKIREKFEYPVELYEMGASCGLNLQLNRFCCEFSGHRFGDSSSNVNLNPQWSGSLPKRNTIEIVSRMGCDLNPLYMQKREDRERAMAYIWPDQAHRIRRTENAINIALENPPVLEKCGADQWVSNILGSKPHAGLTRVFYHTIAWQYFPTEAQEKITSVLFKEGAAATNKCPLVWLSFEIADNGYPVLTMQQLARRRKTDSC